MSHANKPRALPPWADQPRPWLALVWFLGAPVVLLFVAHTAQGYAFVISWLVVASAIFVAREISSRRLKHVLQWGDVAHGKVSEKSSRMGRTPTVTLTIVHGKSGEHRLVMTVPDIGHKEAWKPLANLEVGDQVTLSVDPKDSSRAGVLAVG
jgi:hypothetical protein